MTSQTYTVKFSMDGYRKQLSSDVEQLRDMAKLILQDEWFDKEDFENLVNELICKSNGLNCVWYSGDPMFTDMSDLEVELLEETEW